MSNNCKTTNNSFPDIEALHERNNEVWFAKFMAGKRFMTRFIMMSLNLTLQVKNCQGDLQLPVTQDAI